MMMLIALCKLNSNKSMMMAERNLLRDAFALRNVYAKNNLNDVVLHTNCPALFYFLQTNTRFHLTAKMSNMPIDHQ